MESAGFTQPVPYHSNRGYKAADTVGHWLTAPGNFFLNRTIRPINTPTPSMPEKLVSPFVRLVSFAGLAISSPLALAGGLLRAGASLGRNKVTVLPAPEQTPAAEQIAEKASDEIKMMTVNTLLMPEYMCAFKGEESPQARAAILAREIIKEGCDFVSCQEVFDEDLAAEMAKLLTKAGYNCAFNAGNDALHVIDSGLFIASKHPLSNIEFHPYGFKSAKGEDAFANKGVLIATATLPDGEQIVLANTHLNAGGKGIAQKKQRRILVKTVEDYTRKHITDFQKHSGTFISGDFNTNPNQDHWYRASSRLETLGNKKRGGPLESDQFLHSFHKDFWQPEQQNPTPVSSTSINIKRVKAAQRDLAQLNRIEAGRLNLGDRVMIAKKKVKDSVGALGASLRLLGMNKIRQEEEIKRRSAADAQALIKSKARRTELETLSKLDVTPGWSNPDRPKEMWPTPEGVVLDYILADASKQWRAISESRNAMAEKTDHCAKIVVFTKKKPVSVSERSEGSIASVPKNDMDSNDTALGPNDDGR